jgi:hypothetical protein
MYGTQPHPSEGVRSSNFQLDTPNGRNPDDSYVAERRRNYLVDIGFDPVESHQQPLHPPLPLRDIRFTRWVLMLIVMMILKPVESLTEEFN